MPNLRSDEMRYEADLGFNLTTGNAPKLNSWAGLRSIRGHKKISQEWPDRIGPDQFMACCCNSTIDTYCSLTFTQIETAVELGQRRHEKNKHVKLNRFLRHSKTNFSSQSWETTVDELIVIFYDGFHKSNHYEQYMTDSCQRTLPRRQRRSKYNTTFWLSACCFQQFRWWWWILATVTLF